MGKAIQNKRVPGINTTMQIKIMIILLVLVAVMAALQVGKEIEDLVNREVRTAIVKLPQRKDLVEE